MGIKIIKSILVLAFSLVASACFAEDIVRVGITDNSFEKVKHSDVRVYATGNYLLCDKDSRRVIAKIPAAKQLRVTHEEDSFLVNVDGEKTLGVQSFVLVSEDGVFGIEGLKRKAVACSQSLPGMLCFSRLNLFNIARNLGTAYLGGPATPAVSRGKPNPWNGEMVHLTSFFKHYFIDLTELSSQWIPSLAL